MIENVEKLYELIESGVILKTDFLLDEDNSSIRVEEILKLHPEKPQSIIYNGMNNPIDLGFKQKNKKNRYIVPKLLIFFSFVLSLIRAGGQIGYYSN